MNSARRSVAFSGILAVLAMAILLAHAQQQSQTSALVSSESPTSLKALAPELRSKTRIPLRLPTYLPDTRISAVLREADGSHYEILLAIELPCEGGNWCLYGTLEGSWDPLEAIEGKSVTVSLGKGITGHFTEAHCHAYCSQAYIRWKEGDTFDSIGIKAGNKHSLIRAAKSSLELH